MTGVLHIVLARKPVEGTVAENCLSFGCGALNIDGCRIEGIPRTTHADGNHRTSVSNGYELGCGLHGAIPPPMGRFPANLILDDSDEMEGQFPQSMSTGGKSPIRRNRHGWKDGYFTEGVTTEGAHTGGLGDKGSAARFFFRFSEQESSET